MTTWEYGYLYIADGLWDLKLRKSGESTRVPGYVAVVRLRGGRTVEIIKDDLTFMDNLGAKGWMLNQGVWSRYDLKSEVVVEKLKELGVAQSGGHWSYFMRRQVS